jgi:hypothetical protein
MARCADPAAARISLHDFFRPLRAGGVGAARCPYRTSAMFNSGFWVEGALACWRQAECLPPHFFQTRMREQISFCF